MHFGYVELAEAGRLLTVYKTHHDKTENMGDEVALEFNPNNGNVFLVDGNYNVAMMQGNELADWYSCPQCGNEGFSGDEYDFKKYNGYCSKKCEKQN